MQDRFGGVIDFNCWKNIAENFPWCAKKTKATKDFKLKLTKNFMFKMRVALVFRQN